MNAWLPCSDTKDAVPLYPALGLYLKPVALLHISVRLPALKAPANAAVSHFELMEKLKQWIQPEQFVGLKVSKSTLEFVRFDGELESKSKLAYVLGRVDGRSVKLAGLKEALKVRAVEWKGDFPSKHDWDAYFRDAKDANEMRAGERPDTVYLGNVPCRWFASSGDDEEGGSGGKPSERLLRKVFEQFGPVRRIDVPMLDPFRSQMNVNISGVRQFTFNQAVIFEAYVQFEEYMCFVKCMDALRGMKLVFIDKGKKAYAASIKVDFDKSKHLSDGSVYRRSIVRERLEKKEAERLAKELKQKEEEEKVENEKRLQKLERRKMREQKRKEKQLEKLKLKEVDEMNKKIAVEEYLLLMAQRKLESIRLLGELINRIKIEKEKEMKSSNNKNDRRKRKSLDDDSFEDLSKKAKENIAGLEVDAEKDLRYKLIQKFKRMQQEELIKEKVRLKALATDGSTTLKKPADSTALSLSSNSGDETDTKARLGNEEDSSQRRNFNRYPNQRNWQQNRNRNDRQYGGDRSNGNFGNFDDYPNNRGGRFNRNRRGGGQGRPMYGNQWRQQFPNQQQCLMPIVDPMLLSYSHEYYRYLKRMARDSKRSRSRSRSSRSYTRSRSRSRSRTRSRFKSRSRSRSRSRSYRRNSRSRSRSRKRSYTRSYSRDSRSRSRRRSRSSRRSRSRSKSRTREQRSPAAVEAGQEQPKPVEDPQTKDVGDKAAAAEKSSEAPEETDKKRKKSKKEKKKKKKKEKDKGDAESK